MIYIRKIFTQDLRKGKQIAFPKEPSNNFFSFDFNTQSEQNIIFKYKSTDTHNGREISTRLYSAGSEARIDGELKAFLRDELGAHVNDIVLFRKISINVYRFKFVPQTSSYYAAFLNLLDSKNHVVGVEQNRKVVNANIVTKQIIYFGAPGTGKSHTIKNDTSDSVNKIKTTFHPDSDYASFVGCYKPQVENDDKTISYKFTPQAFANAYVEAWKLLLGGEMDISSLDLENEYGKWLPNNGVRSVGQYKNSIKNTKYEDYENGFNITDPTIIDIIIESQFSGENISKSDIDKRSHLKKYKIFLEWLNPRSERESTDKNFYLVIEEINRGNCAQIFGDLFQLLDRNEKGFSEYVIDVDKDFTDFLIKELVGLNGYKEEICRLADIDIDNFLFSKIALPCNLSILATMNTSDQSLFPMDSAFKRRWDWTYVPIQPNKVDKVVIKIGAERYSWSNFITVVNEKIFKAHESEDKQLGPFFAKIKKETETEGKEIEYLSEEQFVSKVLFYLWFEVFKDEVSNNIFFTKEKSKDSNNLNNKAFTFNKLFIVDDNGESKTDSAFLNKFMLNSLEMKPLSNESDIVKASDEATGTLETENPE